MNNSFIKYALASVILMLSNTANAGLITFYDTVVGGQAHYDATVAASSVTSNSNFSLTSQSSGNSWNFPDFTISTASSKPWIDPVQGYAMTGAAISTSSTPNALDIVTFTFTSAINAFGFELGDWGTCCFPSTVRASFDGGAWVDIGTMTQESDNPNYDSVNTANAANDGTVGKGVFLGLIDDSALFNSVAIDFTASGDVLYLGGTIKYSTFDVGGAVPVDNPNAVPEPQTFAIFALALMGLIIRRFAK